MGETKALSAAGEDWPEAVDEAIEAAGGDAREALRALLVEREMLMALLRRNVSWGYVRGLEWIDFPG